MNIIKIRVLAVIACAVTFATASAQDLIPDQNKKGKWGYVDSNGKKVINYDYNEATAFADGRAKVKKGDKWGYIDPQGKPVIKIDFSEMMNWDNGRCKVAVGGDVKDDVLTGAKWGYINSRGEYLLKPEYDEIGPFKDGRAYVKKGNEYGYINNDFEFVVPCKFNLVGRFNDKGLCWVRQGDKFGIYNVNGKEIVKPEYKHIGTFQCDILESNPISARLVKDKQMQEIAKKLKKEASKGLTKNALAASFGFGSLSEATDRANQAWSNWQEMTINEGANLLTEEERMLMATTPNYGMLGYKFVEETLFSELDMSKSEYLAVSNQGYILPDGYIWSMENKINDKIGIITPQGDIILKPGEYGIAFLPTEGLIPVAKKKGKAYEINYVYESTGKPMMKKWMPATSVTPFSNGVAIVPNGEQQMLINRNGEQISGVYNLILPERDGVYIMQRNDNYGLLGKDGKEILPARNGLILPATDGLMLARESKNGSYGYMNAKGDFVIAPKYKNARQFVNGIAGVQTEQGWGIIDTADGGKIDFKWQDVMVPTTGTLDVCWVKDGESWRNINASGAYNFDGSYSYVENYDDKGQARVANDEKRFGLIDRQGNVIVPLRLSSPQVVDQCRAYMDEKGLTTMTEGDARRFNIMSNPDRNSVRFSTLVDNDMWDF